MWVRVEAVTPETIELGNGVVGHRVHFVAGELRGQAWFASSGEPPSLDEYRVETGLQAARRLRVVARISDGVQGLTPLPTCGDYHVRGVVEAVLVDDEEKQISSVYLNAGGWIFMLSDRNLTAEDITTFGMLSVGEVIEFDAIGFSLWDENI